MPTHFGPSCGPREGPGGTTFSGETSHDMTAISVDFLSDREQLSALIPEDSGLRLDGEPIVSVVAGYMKNIDWLAGRAYNILAVYIPVVFEGQRDTAVGQFMIVIWENLTDPIITGREDLGAPKVFADLPDPIEHGGKLTCHASWMGYRFFDMSISNLRSKPLTNTSSSPRQVEGTIWYKYFPRTGDKNEPDARYVTLCPAAGPIVEKSISYGEGDLKFHRADWTDMPTQHHIVSALAALKIIEFRGAVVRKTIGQGDLSDTRILR